MSARPDPVLASRAAQNRGGRGDDAAALTPWEMPLLAARPGGLAWRFAAKVPSRRPVIVFFVAALTGLLTLATVSIAVGFVVTELLLDLAWLRSADEELPDWLADNRSAALTDVSYVGSEMAGRVVLPILVGLVGLLFAAMRKWRAAAFAVFVLLVESATYRATSFVNARERPDVQRLENLPADASYPSGHVAASIAVYSGLVFLITSRFTNSRLRAALWTLAISIATFVALSRMYRGMHHPIDVVAGVLIGSAAIAVLVFACRAAAAASQVQDAVTTPKRVTPSQSEMAT